jgi:hypothetical protein
MKAWLKMCLETHSSCQAFTNQPQTHPTRLINVGEHDTDIPYLCTSEFALNCSYSTLSHYWGQIPIVTLTRYNLKEFKRCIPFQDLTKTFQEAITTTRMLGIRYIWIDSLCIIQEDIPDWARESAQMASVYSQSRVNIAASAAPDGRTGLFLDRNPKLLAPLELKVKWNANPRIIYSAYLGYGKSPRDPSSVHLSQNEALILSCELFDKSFYVRDIEGGPLSKRA